jgi:diguanylate cyclase (GGDEF)-like protein/PAS domain S-box-containing protein
VIIYSYLDNCIKRNILQIGDNLNKTNIFKPIIIATIIIVGILSFYIPYITDKNSIKTIINQSLNSVRQIKLTRAYYVDTVVKDIKAKAPNIKFSYDHQGVNGVIPLPTTVIHDLSGIFSEKTGIRYNLYSKYPFKNRADRNLTQFQQEALVYIEQSPDGIYTKRDIIDDKPVIRVAVADFMTSQACVKCHNAHPDATWGKDKWKVGDKRGILEVITPIEDEIAANNMVKYSILALIVTILVTLLGYFSSMFIRREKELFQTIDKTSDALEKEIEVSSTNESLLQEYKNAIDVSAIVSKAAPNGKITYVNDEFCNISGYTREELLGKYHNIVKHQAQDKEEFVRLWDTITSKKVYKGTLKNISKNGKVYYVDATIVPILDKEENILEYLAIRYNVSNHIQAIHYAYTDNLTGISNRNKFEEVIKYELKQLKRQTNPKLSIAILDIDHFKNFNDNFGHLIGDEVLILLSQSIQKHIRETDTFARWGGEEFVILLKDTDIEQGMKIIEKLRAIVENTHHKKAGKITASFGLTQYTHGDTLDTMLERADKALYQSKDAGRNCIKSL